MPSVRHRAALLLLSTCWALALPAQGTPRPPSHPEAAAFVDSAFTLARRHSLWRDTVSWARLRGDLDSALSGATRLEDAYPVVRLLLRRLGDRHSFLVLDSDEAPGIPSPSEDAGRRVVDRTPRLLERGRARIGYVHVPGNHELAADVVASWRSATRAALREQASSGACGWVVDLRANHGGDMWPMLEGLRPLLGPNLLGAFRSGGGERVTTEPWSAAGTRGATDAGDDGPDLHEAPVAVLTDGGTWSSGEAVVVSFRGRPLTRSFGMPTGGLSTANRIFRLPAHAQLYLTTTVLTDRRGRVYGGPIAPDELVAASRGMEAPLTAALAWLERQPACLRGR